MNVKTALEGREIWNHMSEDAILAKNPTNVRAVIRAFQHQVIGLVICKDNTQVKNLMFARPAIKGLRKLVNWKCT